jgi:uncharacterized protein YbjQ (UPF0145 family)
MLITTSFDFPGYNITSVQGEIFGLTVRARNIGAGCMAGLRSIGGGEIPEFTKLLSQSRSEAMARMVEEARGLGSTAIVAMRFDSGAIGQWSEICAYGTGVTVEPLTDYAKQQFEYFMQTGAMPQQGAYSTQISEWGGPGGSVPPPQPGGLQPVPQPSQPGQPGQPGYGEPMPGGPQPATPDIPTP